MTDDEGFIFIDRDGTTFETILNYLRSGTLVIPPYVAKESLRVEADFYGIQPIIDVVASF